MQPKILITSLMTKVRENYKRDQIEYEPQLILINNTGDIQAQQSGISVKYQYPVITEQCNHLKNCYNLEQVRQDLKNQGKFQCKQCSTIITSEEQLIKDIRWYANEEFHELVQEAMVIEGKLFNRYQRQKRFTDFLSEKQIRSYIMAMMSRFVEKESSINSLLLDNLQQNSQSQYKTGSTQIISFWAICLLDKVKLTIPVRIIGCKHKECYDFTSLLAYQKENAKQPDSEKIFFCLAEGCYQKLDVSSVQNMVTQLVIDLHLLNALKMSPPSTFKFVFNQTTLRIECEVQRKDGIAIDQAIYEYYRKRKQTEGSTVIMNEYQIFERQVQQSITNILQQSVTKEIEKKLRCQKYQVAQINMQDQFTGYTVEYPVRCKHVDNLTTSYDLRTVIADFVYDKQKQSTAIYVCKLCNQPQHKPLASIQIQGHIYLDQNLFQRMFKDMSYLQNKLFKYDGKSYMRQEFYDKQKIEMSEYLKGLKGLQTQGEIMTVEIKNIYCSKNKNTLITMPLLLKQCPKQNIIDFETFYTEMQKFQFDLESNEREGLILCQCDTCNKNPIKKIIGNVYYHEAFGEAFREFKKSGSTAKSFKFDFQRMCLSNASTAIPGSANIPVTGRDGFVDLMNDEDYQNAFKVQQVLGGRHFQILSMSQDIADGISVTHNAQGASGNLEAKKKEMNQYAEQNQQLKKWNFQVQKIELQLNNDLIKINKGNLGDTPTNPG